jgi:hypothetical protein
MGTMQLALALAGEKIVIAGLALQVATFVVFLIASFDFQIRMNKKADHASADWKKMLYILIAHEWTLYCFDAVPMVLVLVMLLVLQPSRYVEGNLRMAQADSDGETAVIERK